MATTAVAKATLATCIGDGDVGDVGGSGVGIGAGDVGDVGGSAGIGAGDVGDVGGSGAGIGAGDVGDVGGSRVGIGDADDVGGGSPRYSRAVGVCVSGVPVTILVCILGAQDRANTSHLP